MIYFNISSARIKMHYGKKSSASPKEITLIQFKKTIEDLDEVYEVDFEFGDSDTPSINQAIVYFNLMYNNDYSVIRTDNDVLLSYLDELYYKAEKIQTNNRRGENSEDSIYSRDKCISLKEVDTPEDYEARLLLIYVLIGEYKYMNPTLILRQSDTLTQNQIDYLRLHCHVRRLPDELLDKAVEESKAKETETKNESV